MNIENLVEDSIFNYPLLLLSIKDKETIYKINEYLPYSIGIEIECEKSSIFNLNNFTSIPDIMEVSIDETEQRFRIPNGLAGLICLYNICIELKSNSLLNPASGHHYHIDMTNTYSLLTNSFIEKNKEWMLNELDIWNYTGRYNHRNIEFNTNHNWMRFQSSFATAEIRIGNMTFDYDIIVKRLIHACKIIRQLNLQLVDKENIKYVTPNIDKLRDTIKYKNNSKLKYLYSQLQEFENKSTIIVDNKQFKNRVIKINQ